MPVFKLIGGSASATNTLDYCDKKAVMKEGVHCFANTCSDDFKATRDIYDKTDGRQSMHFVLTFNSQELNPKSEEDQVNALQMGVEMALQISTENESVCFVHNDKDHLHCHIVVNSVSFETGEKYQIDTSKYRYEHPSKEYNHKNLFELREKSDAIVKKYGIEPLPGDRVTNKTDYTRQDKIKSWKENMKTHVEEALKDSTSVYGFKKKLNENGIDYVERGKTCTFIDLKRQENGVKKFKARSSTLIDDLTRVGIENQLQANLELYREDHKRRLAETKENMRVRKEKEVKEKEYSKNMPSIQTPSVSQILNDDQEKWKAQKDYEQLQKQIAYDKQRFDREF